LLIANLECELRFSNKRELPFSNSGEGPFADYSCRVSALIRDVPFGAAQVFRRYGEGLQPAAARGVAEEERKAEQPTRVRAGHGDRILL
jgi:hypothetical protein